MERVIKSALAYGDAWVTEDVSGVLFFLPPSRTRLADWDFVKCGFLALPMVIGLRLYPGVDECEKHVADTQEKLLAGRPHYYLWGLAVDPVKQRTGSGKALLESFLKKADGESIPVYLETHKQENVAYYERYGFKLVLTETIPKHSLKFWCLLREPGGA
jgi:ribosomal protein S18 acetylase RimI-like enzyme